MNIINRVLIVLTYCKVKVKVHLLGCEMPKAELANLDRITVRTLSVFRKIGKTKEMLLDITADGVIDESEKPELDEVVKNLEEVEEIAQSMRLWIKKNM